MQPSRGEIWRVNFDLIEGHEQAGSRPALVISVDPFNHGPAGLAVVLPLTTRRKGIPFHVALAPPEGGIDRESFIKCEDVRSVSTRRFSEVFGKVTQQTLEAVEDRLRILLEL